MTLKTIGHLSYATSSSVYHFTAIGQFKLELQSGNAQFGSKSTNFLSCSNLKFESNLKKHSAPHLCYFKLCASFQSHLWVQIGVRKRPIWVKIGDFSIHVTLKIDAWPWKAIGNVFFVSLCFMHHFIVIDEFKLKLQPGNAQFRSQSVIFLSRMTLKFDGWHRKTIEHLSYATASFVHHFVAMRESKLELQSGKICFDLYDLDIWPLTLTFCIGITFVNAYHSGKCHDDTMTGTLWIQWQEHCEKGIADRQTDGRMDGQPEVFLQLLGRS